MGKKYCERKCEDVEFEQKFIANLGTKMDTPEELGNSQWVSSDVLFLNINIQYVTNLEKSCLDQICWCFQCDAFVGG